MHEFHGHLLIGGMSLKDLDGQLDKEDPQQDSGDWNLAGKVNLSNQTEEHLELGRTYRLLLDDGRAGQVVVENLVHETDHLVAEFRPGARAK